MIYYFTSRHDHNGVYLHVSENVSEILGYEPSELIGKSAYDFFDTYSLTPIVTSHLSKNSTEVKYKFRNKKGKMVQVKTFSFKDLKKDEIYCITRKLTPFEIILLKLKSIFKIG